MFHLNKCSRNATAYLWAKYVDLTQLLRQGG